MADPGDRLRIARYEIPADGKKHEVTMFAAADARMAQLFTGGATGHPKLMIAFWAEHYDSTEYDRPRAFVAIRTGELVPDGFRWVATAAGDGPVWHLCERG